MNHISLMPKNLFGKQNLTSFLSYSNNNVYTYPHFIKTTQLQNSQRNAVWNYLNSAIKGHIEAQYKLGMIYLTGELGTDRNYRYADQWLLKAKQHGHQGAADALSHAYTQLAI